jgi:hypothetical protein
MVIFHSYVSLPEGSCVLTTTLESSANHFSLRRHGFSNAVPRPAVVKHLVQNHQQIGLM